MYMALASIGLHIPRIETIRINPWSAGILKTKFGKLWLWCFDTCKALILQSEDQRAFFKKSVQKKAVVIPNPINANYVENEKTESDEIPIIGFGVDVERADALITDSLAKDLLKKEGDIIYTSGSERATVTVDTLNTNFAIGDRVDINVLKEKGLVPENALHLKVVAEGTLDKALRVYANDFTLTAIKMLSLEGGDAIKVTTVRDKVGSREEEDLVE